MDFDILIGIFPQVLLDGIILGFMYALIALGYTMVYGVLEFINFAHSEIFIIGAFVGVEILLSFKAAGWLDVLPWPLVLVIILAAGMLVSGVVAMVIERTAYRPLRHAPRLIPLISAIGVSFFLQDVIRLFESLGYRRWGRHPAYARVSGKIVSGHFLWKPLTESLKAEP